MSRILLLPVCRRGCARGGGALSRAGGAQALFRKEEFRLRASTDKPALLVAKQELTEAAMSLEERLKLEVPLPRLCRRHCCLLAGVSELKAFSLRRTPRPPWRSWPRSARRLKPRRWPHARCRPRRRSKRATPIDRATCSAGQGDPGGSPGGKRVGGGGRLCATCTFYSCRGLSRQQRRKGILGARVSALRRAQAACTRAEVPEGGQAA